MGSDCEWVQYFSLGLGKYCKFDSGDECKIL